jgi:hypothetical protein
MNQKVVIWQGNVTAASIARESALSELRSQEEDEAEGCASDTSKVVGVVHMNEEMRDILQTFSMDPLHCDQSVCKLGTEKRGSCCFCACLAYLKEDFPLINRCVDLHSNI